MNKKTATFFGIGAFGKDVMYAMSTILNIFFISYLGMNPAWIGIMFMVVRVWDAINDPIMGTIVQNTKSKWGKFRPWILIGSIINAVFLLFVFNNPGLDPESKGLFVYMTIFSTLWGMSYTLMDIPFWSMLPTFSKDQKN
jgi:melibiose permease